MSKVKRKKPIEKKHFEHKEKEILELAKIAWNYTIKEFYYPPLNEPNYVFDYTRKEVLPLYINVTIALLFFTLIWQTGSIAVKIMFVLLLYYLAFDEILVLVRTKCMATQIANISRYQWQHTRR